MLEQDDEVGLAEDLVHIQRSGLGVQNLRECRTLLELYPVEQAAKAGILRIVAARTLLVVVAERAHGNKYVRYATEMAGIYPPDAGRGVRNDAGPGPREERIADREKRSKRTIQDYVSIGRDEYGDAILEYVRELKCDATALADFLRKCKIPERDIAKLLRTIESSSTEASTLLNPPDSLSRSPSPHPIRLAGQLRRDLDAARTYCETKRRAFYTFDMLLAMLDTSDSRVVKCFEQVKEGLAEEVRQELHRMPAPGRATDPFKFREWEEREEDVIPALRYALADGTPAITELHLFLAILDGESKTNAWLKEFLGSRYRRLRAFADQMRHERPKSPPSPTPY